MTEKKCEACEQEFESTHGRQRFCKQQACIRARKNARMRAYTATEVGGQKVRAHSQQKYEKRRAEMDDLKRAPCMDCGNSFPPECMDWDHRPDEEKLFEVGTRTMGNWELLLAEMAKCDLICSNCHRIRTRKRKLGGRPRTS